MSGKKNSKRIKELEISITNASDAYYNPSEKNKKHVVSDSVWDAWFDELKALDPTNPLVNEAIGAPLISDWNKVRHEVQMASLNKVNSDNEFRIWARECDCDEYLATEKLDGISISLKYENGELTQALTRGKGDYGEDILSNVKKMKGVLLKLKKPFIGHIRGEIILLKSDFNKYFPDYANPRNTASGVAKRYDGEGSEHLTVLCYAVEGEDFKKESDAFKRIESLGLQTPPYQVTDTEGCITLMKKYHDEVRASLDYDIDGKVFTVNDSVKKFALGNKGRGPVGSIAFKFASPTAVSTLRRIDWQVGGTGRVTPVGIFDVVDIGGVKVERASLYNLSYIESIGVGIGASVLVSRRNDVIPRIEEVVTPTTVENSPKYCPECNNDLKFDGEYLICNNKSCPAQVLGRISSWINELGIMEWGDKVLSKMIDAGLISDVPDIYTLTESQIAGLDKMGEKSAKALLNELDKFREVPLYNFIGGLGINNVATSTSKLVIGAGFDSVDKMLALKESNLESIDGFGSIRAKAFVQGLKENKDRIERLLKVVKIKAKPSGSLNGLSFCFTGSSNLPRKSLQRIVEEAGGEVKNSVGKGLDYLIVADPSVSSSKTKAAEKNNTRLLSEEAFLKMANYNG